MSLTGALITGVTGMLANTTALSAISDNITNMNTVGYKRADANFQTLVTSGESGSGGGGGVTATIQNLVSEQGLPTSTTSATDLAISGNGFFVTTEKSSNLQSSDARLFTRAGSFTVDKNGYLKNSAGLFLQGWPVDQSTGTITTNPSDLTQLSSINVTTVGGAADPTTTVTLAANLDANQPTTTFDQGNYTQTLDANGFYETDSTANMANYDASASPVTGVKPDFSIQVPVSDSQGGKRVLQLDMLKTDTANTWDAELVVVPASDVTTGAGLYSGQVAVGSIVFNANGTLDATDSTLFGGSSTPTINFGASSAAAPSAGQVNWASNLGIAAQSITLNVAAAGGGLTQYASPSVAESVQTNGTEFGNLTNIQIGTDGIVTAIFDNGVSRQLAQIAIATVPNPDGLLAVSGQAYQVTNSSGTFTLSTPGSAGAGALETSSLEASNVDLSTEFTNLIVTQRAYSASSKIITTVNQMMQDLLQIVQ